MARHITDKDIGYSILQFGAKGDGTTDNTTNFQNALNIARDNGSLKLFIPDGTYCISGYLRLYKNTRIEMSQNAVIKRTGSTNKVFINGQSGNDTYSTIYNGEGNIHFVGGTIDLNYASLVISTTGSVTTGTATLTVPSGSLFSANYNVSVAGAGASGAILWTTVKSLSGNTITLNDNASTTVTNAVVKIYLTQTAFDLGHGENISFTNLTIKGGHIGHGFQISGCKNVRLKDCWFGGVTWTYQGSTMFEFVQIEALASNSFPTFGSYDNTISRDIYVDGCTFDTVIRGVGTHSDGLYGGATTIFCENINVKNCTFKNTFDNSMNLTAFKYSNFENNVIMNSGAYGIYHNKIEDSTIGKNKIINANKAGIHMDASNNNKFIENIIDTPSLLNTYAGIRITTSNGNTFDNNTVKATTPNYSYAIYSSGGCVDNDVAISNKFTAGKSGLKGGDFGLTWVSVGDSITAGNNSGNGYYQDYALPLMPKVSTHYNRGYSSYSFTKYSNSGTGASIIDVTSSMETADVYTVFLGTNDFSRSAIIGSTADATGKLDSMWGAMKQLYVDLTGKNMNAVIVFITPMKRTLWTGAGSGSTIDWNTANSAGFKLADYVQAIKDFCSQYGCPVIDLFNESGVSSRTSATMLFDGLHPFLTTNVRIGKMIGNGVNLHI